MSMKSTTWRPIADATERLVGEERSLAASRFDEIGVVVSLLGFLVLFFYTVFVS
ncbi:MAG TPA: hypothetical protein VLK65_25550 [Vicinamibacteria bacterium]|nr:hypothetical protein [Vicinamibacteria bacterium]